MARKKGKGNCLTASFNLLLVYHINRKALPDKVMLLMGLFGIPKWVHGMVYHPNVGHHPHAWVEDDMFCYDFANDNEGVFIKDEYYRLGSIEETNLVRYEYKDAVRLLNSTGKYAFYDPIFSKV